jgi:hypothetical protein
MQADTNMQLAITDFTSPNAWLWVSGDVYGNFIAGHAVRLGPNGAQLIQRIFELIDQPLGLRFR